MENHEKGGPGYPTENAIVIEGVVLPEPPPEVAAKPRDGRNDILHRLVMGNLGAPMHLILRVRDAAVDAQDQDRVALCDDAMTGRREAVEKVAPFCVAQAAADEAASLAAEKAEAERLEFEAALAVLEMIDAGPEAVDVVADTEPSP